MEVTTGDHLTNLRLLVAQDLTRLFESEELLFHVLLRISVTHWVEVFCCIKKQAGLSRTCASAQVLGVQPERVFQAMSSTYILILIR